jgi:hypothetical protein
MMNAVRALQEALRDLQPGPVSDPETVRRIEEALRRAWEDLGVRDGGMAGYKILGRTESVNWDPPYLLFEIERHGAFVLGSSRAGIQAWVVNVEEGCAHLERTGRRQKSQLQKAIRTKPIAAELAELMDTRQEDQRLEWSKSGAVRIRVNEVFPSANKQTQAGRRKRLFRDVSKHLEGWTRNRQGWWIPPI